MARDIHGGPGGPRDRRDGDNLPTRHLPPVTYKDMPEPLPLRKVLGPGVIAAGIGLASGEFILWPYITSQVGLVFLWAAVVGVVTQFFINMEIERYTLATGETALTGFSRYWRHWGLFFAVLTFLANAWPGWITSSATLVTFIFGGGNVKLLAILGLASIAIALTMAPVVYTMVERIEFFKVGIILFFIVVAIATAITADAWGAAGRGHQLRPPARGPAAGPGPAGAGLRRGRGRPEPGPEQLDAGQGLRHGRARPPPGLAGHRRARGRARHRLHLPRGRGEPGPLEGLVGRGQQGAAGQLRGHHHRHHRADVAAGLLDRVRHRGREQHHLPGGRGQRPHGAGRRWFGYLFWIIGATSLFAAALGIVDYTCRLVADVLKVSYLRDNETWSRAASTSCSSGCWWSGARSSC